MKLEDLDFNNINIKNESVQETLKTTFQNWIDESFKEMNVEGMIDIWYANQMYYEGYMTPTALTNDALRDFISNNRDLIDQKSFNANTFRTKINKDKKLFFQDNKITEVIDNEIGDFTSVKKVINVKSDKNPTNDKISKIVSLYLEKHESKEQVWEQYRIPNIEGMMINGLYWGKISYNPYVNLPEGKIIYESIHPSDVAIDPKATNSRQKYFLDVNYIVHKKRFTLDEAKRYLANFSITPDRVNSDNDYYQYGDTNYVSGDSNEQFVTIYYIEYKRENIIEYDKGVKELLTNYYQAIYNSSLGVIEHKINKYADPRRHNAWQYSIFPYYNKQSKLRIYPQSDIEKFIVVQDIINIMKTMILDSAKSRTKLRLIVLTKLKEKFPDLWDTFEKYGGTFPVDPEDLKELGVNDIRAAIQSVEVQPLPKEVYDFLNIAEQSFKDQSVRHEALQGKYAERGNSNLSGVAIEKMMEQNKLSGLYKEINIQWVATQEAIYIYRIIAQEFNQADFIKIQNGNTGADYIPVNTVMSVAEFNQYLAKQFPNVPTEQAIDIFQQDNDIKVIIPTKDESGMPITNIDELENLGVVFINYIRMPDGQGKYQPYELNISIDLDFESDKNRIEEKLIANQLFTTGYFVNSPTFMKDFLELQGGVFESNADKILSEISEADKAKQLGEALIKSGLEQQAVMLLQSQTQQTQQTQQQ